MKRYYFVLGALQAFTAIGAILQDMECLRIRLAQAWECNSTCLSGV